MKNRVFYFTLLFLSCNLEAFALPDCSSAFLTAQDRHTRKLCQKEWTTLVYMAADNDLDPYAKMDLAEMEKVGSGINSDVIIEGDFLGDDGIYRFHILKDTRHKIFQIPQVEDYQNRPITSFVSRVISKTKEDQDKSERRLKRFIKWGMRNYPAKHTTIIIWGHGLGWNGGVGSDDSSSDSLSVPALARALSGKEIDFLISDACLMQMAENLTELSPYAHYLVGTSQIQNYLGLPYQKVLSLFSEKVEPYKVALSLPQIMQDSLLEKSKEMSMSVVEGHNWQNGFVPQFKNFVRLLKSELKNYPDDIKPALSLSLKKGVTYENGSIELAKFLDLLHYELTHLLKNPYSADSLLLVTLRKVRGAIEESTLAYAIGDLNQSWGNRSLSFWMPKNIKEFNRDKEVYSKSIFDQQTGWTDFLDSYFNSIP